MAHSVIFSQGKALIAGTLVVPVSAAGAHGEIQIDGGAILRPLTFGERTRIVNQATAHAAPALALTQRIVQAAQVQAGNGDGRVLEILALALAGADEEAPPFMESALLVARAAGWSITQIYEAEAAEIDRFAVYLGGQTQPDDGWNRIVFMSSPSSDTLEDVCRAMAERLLLRADASANPHPAVEAAAVVHEDETIPNRDETQHTEAIDAAQTVSGQSSSLQPAQMSEDEVPVGGFAQAENTLNSSSMSVEPASKPRGYIRVRTQPTASSTAATAAPVSTAPTLASAVRQLASAPNVSIEPSISRPVGRSLATPSVREETTPKQRTVAQPARVLTRSSATMQPTTAANVVPVVASITEVRNEITPPAREAGNAVDKAEAPLTAMQLQLDDLADVLAEKLDLEADLRGLER